MKSLYYKSPLILFILIFLQLIFIIELNAQCTTPTTPVVVISPNTAICGQQNVNFTIDPASIQAGATYTWNFGDSSSNSNTASGTNVSHAFTPSSGGATFNVIATVSVPTIPVAATWTNLINSTISNDSLIKSLSSNSYNSSANTTQTIGEGEFIGFVADPNTQVAFGLSDLSSGSPSTGTVNYERFTGISGTSIATLTNSADFPNNPSFSGTLTSLDAPNNIGSNFGSKIYGYIEAPQTGTYYFTITGDDHSHFYLSSDEDPSNLYLIAYLNGWTNVTQFNKYSTQRSIGFSLVAGERYYFEVLHKEGGGGDHVQVYWETPSNATPTIIPGANLSPYVGLSSIDYAIETQNGVITIYESGVSQGTFGSASLGDTLAVGILNGQVVYYQNGSIIYTSSNAPSSLSLSGDISISSGNGVVAGAFIGGQSCSASGNASVTSSPTPGFTIGSSGFDRQQTCQTIINPGDQLGVVFGFSSGYDPTHIYTIDYGDGGGAVPLVGNVTGYTYTSPGVYIVTVTGDNGAGCIGTFQDTIFYLDRPLADMSIVGTADVCEGDTVFTLNNTDTISHRVVYYIWEWGDGSQDTVFYQDSADHVFDLGDNLLCSDVPNGGMPYDVTLYAVNECFQHTNSSPITVSQTPTGDLNTVTIECNSVASSTGIPFSLNYCTYGIAGTPSWSFGDPASGALDSLAFPPENPTHIFVGGPGFYDITVNIQTLCGEYNDTARVHILQEPTANATFSTNGSGPIANGDGCNPVELYFNNSSTGDSLVYAWTVSPSGGTSFINGTSDTSANAQVLFNTAGEFIVNMTATNPCGVSTWADTIIVVDGPTITLTPPNPTCDSFSYTPTVTYFDGGGAINTYAWEFFEIDATPNNNLLATSNQPFPTYNFTSSGDYMAIISITNDCTTQSDTVIFTIQATPGPIIINGGIPVETCIGNAPITLTPNLVGGTWSGTGINSSGVFDPSSVVAGTYTVYYNYDIGNGCPADVPVDVTVHPLPTANAGSNINVCINEPAFDISTGTPMGGTWSGTGITNQSNGTFDPATAGVGLHMITYTYSDGNNCENSDDLVVNVSGLPTVNAQGDVTYCDVEYDIQLNVGTPVGGTWSGAGALYNNPGYFNIDSAGGLGTYTLYYTYVDANNCENLDSTEITVVTNIVANAGSPDTLCINSGTYTLNNFTPTGGIWSGAGMIGQGPDFSPSAAGVGTHPLVYFVGSGTCSDTDTVDFIVEAITNVDAGNDTLICIETDAITLSPSPMGGVWSGPGITDGSAGIFNPNTAGIGTFFLTYSYTNPITECVSSDVMEVTIAPLPTVDAGGIFQMCDTAASFPITGYTPLGGTWSGPGITDPTNAMFNPNTAGGLGYNGQDTTHTLYYSYTDGNGCENIDSLLMTVTYGDTLKLRKTRDTICINSGIYTITNFSPLGGIWSGPGIIGTSPNFSPSAAGVGIHTLTYISGTGSCLKQITLEMHVDPIPTVDAGSDILICANDPVYTLSGHSPLGGVWTGTGILDGSVGTFDPTIATGTYSLTYTYTDPVTGCENTDTRLITISPLPVVTVASSVTECYIPTDITLTNYNPAGGVWSGSGIVDANSGVFNGDTAGGIGLYDLVYTYTDGNGCMNTDTMEMELVGILVADAGPGDTVCVYDSPITLTNFTPSGGTWTGTGITNGTTGEFDPGQVSAGTYTLIYTVGSGTCEDSDQTTVLVGGVPNVDAKADESVCVSTSPFNLTTATPTNGYWSGNGITDSIMGTFDPALVGDGTHPLTYTYINPLTGCEGSDNKNVIVYPLPNVNAGDTVAYCNTPSNVQLSGFTPTTGGIWSGQGIVDANNGVFNPITAGNVGTYPVVLTYTDGNNCTNDDTLYINVVAGDTVNAGPSDTLCIDDAAISLSGYPTGGIWSGSGITNTAGVFDPSQVSAGFHYPVYTVGTGTCERIDTIEIFVSALPFVDAGNDLDYCIDAGIITMTGQSPFGGYWTGIGITDSLVGTFDPTVAGIGSHTISYIVTNAFGCDNVDTRTITINDLPTVNAGDTVAYCFTPDNIQLSGFTPASGGTWTGTGIIDANNGVFNANLAGANGIGTYNDIVLTYTDGNNCTNSDSLTIIIEFGDTINAGLDLAMCIDNGLDTLTGYIPTNGGTWAGTGIVNSNLGVFDPASAGGGIHELVFTFGSGTCLKTDTIEVLVGTIPTVDAGTNQAMCIDEPAFNLIGFSPSNGIWTGTGITDGIAGIFNADSAGAGTHTLTYTFINSITGCENFDTKQIIVYDLPVVNAGDTVQYCNNPDNITLAGYSPLGGNWSGTGIIDNINGIFNTVNAGGEGTYYPIYTYTDANGCTNFDTLVIEVIYGDTVDAGDPIGICITDGNHTINNGYQPSTGGTWSGTGIINSSDGIFDPTLVSSNTLHTIYYTYGVGTCEKTDSTTIFVGTVPFVEAGDNDTICELDGILTLSGFVPSSGGVWSGIGVVPGTNTFDPSISGNGTFTLTYYYQVAFTGCEKFDTKTVTVIPAPSVNAGNGTIVCNNANDIILTGFSPLGGVWTGSGITNPSGVFNTIIAGGLGVNNGDTSYTLTYTYTDGNGCSNFDTVIYDIIFGDDVSAGADTNICIDGGALVLSGTPVGGTWSGNGIINTSGIFDPSVSGTGTHILTYIYGTGTCQKTDEMQVIVSPALTINAGPDITVCEADIAFTLTGNVPSTSGTWSGIGITDVTNGIFDPSVAGVGTHTITYSFTNTNTNCSDTDTRIVTVSPPPTVFAGNDQTYCNSGQIITLSGYSPSGGFWSGAGIIDPILGEFNTQLAGGIGYNNADTTYQVFYTYNTGSCSDIDTLDITVIFGDTVIAGVDEAVCIDDVAFNLIGFSPSDGTGTWSGAGILDPFLGLFDPATAGVGVHTLTYTYGTGTCQKTDTKTVQVYALPTVNAGNDISACINDIAFNLSGYSPLGGTWLGTGIVDASTGIFNPAAGVGSYTLTYNYVHPITGCESSDTRVVTVNDLPVISMPDTTEFCQIPSNITLSNYVAYAPIGGTWSGPGIVDATNGIFNSTQSGANGIGSYQVFYAYTDGNGCTNTEDLIIDVVFGDTVVAGPNVTICIDNGPYTLTGFSPSGGMYSGTGIIDGILGVFDPINAGVGMHTISYTFGTGTCEKIVTSTITVAPLPVVSAGTDETVCINDAAFILGSYSPLGGIWTGTGITDTVVGTFDPAVAGVGVHTLLYEYTDGNGCFNSDTKTISVSDLPAIAIADTVEYCEIPTNIILSGYSPTGGTWSGPGIVDAVNGIFNSTQAGANGIGTYQVFYAYTDGNGCTNTEDLIIDIIFGDTVVAGPNVDICIDNGLYTLTGFSPIGGIYTGTGIVDATNGIFDPSIAGVGSHTISYTVGTGTCEKTVSITITVEPLPVANAGVDEAVCVNEATFLLSGQSPTGGTWSGTGITDATAGLFDPAIATVGTHNLTYTYTNPSTGCTDSDMKVITVNALPIVVVQDTTVICLNVNNYALTGYSPLGGTWTGTGIVDNNNGIFNAISAGGVGSYTATYTYVDGNGCEASDQMVIVVDPAIAVAAGNDISICIDNGNVQLTGFSPAGGTWTGTGVIDPVNGVFDPQIAGQGNTTLTYTAGSGTCEVSDNINVFVGTTPNVSAGADETVCLTDAAFSLLGASPPNGVWTGIGITDPTGIFDPSASGSGTFTLTYTYINSITSCENFDTKIITVLPPPTVYAGDTVIYCNTNQNITLTNYTPTGGLWSGSGIVDNQNGVFNPNVAGGEGIYQIVYDYTDANGCTNDDTLVVEIIYGDTVYAGLPDTVCIDDAAFTFVNFTPISGGTWTGNGVVDANAGVFDPATAGVGNHVISYTYGDSASYCIKTSTKTVFVGALPTISLGVNDTVCIDAAAFNITGYSPQGGTWSGLGITDANLGTFDPSVTGIGTYTVSYTFVNSVTNCDRTVTKQIVVQPLPTVFVTNSVTYCNNTNDVTLTGFSPSGGVWTGSGIVASSGVFNSSIAGGLGYNGADTTYILTYTFTDNFGCENSADMTVNIIYGDTVEAGPNINVCIDDSPIILGGQLPNSGGTWSGNGITDPIVGIFDPATAGVGSHTITWTFGTGTCLKTSTRTVTVSNPPSISAGVDEVICINDSPILLGSYSPTGGIWSGIGITDTIAGIFDPSVSSIGTFTLTYYYFNTATNCDAADTKIITVAPLPTVNVASSVTYCENPNNVVLTGNSPQGGIWSGPGVLDGLAGIFNTGQAGGLGYNGGDTTYIVTYTYADGNGCENSADMTVNVIFGDTVEAGPNINVCTDDGLIALTGQVPINGGTWSGTGIIDPVAGIFDPAAAGVGTHTVTWTFGTGTCEKISTRNITVSDPPIVNAGINQTICIDNAPILLTGNSPTGGVWSGAGITDSIAGIFDPSVVGVGTFTLTYYFFNAATNCDALDTKTITVVPLPTISTISSVTYCENPNNITLIGYSPTGGTWTGAGIVNGSAGIFNTVQAGGLGYNGGDTTYIVTYGYIDGNGCENFSDMTINVIYGDTVEAGPNIAVCTDDGLVTLVGQLPANGGTWTGTGIIDPIAGTFDPVTAGTGTHTITWTYGTGTCEKTSTRTITVSDPPIVSAGANQTICIDNGTILMTGYSPTGGYWSGFGITDSLAGIFNPSVSGIGTFTLTYYYYNASSNCDALDTKTITVAPLPSVSTTSSVTYCENPNNITLTGYSPQGGIWTGSGVINGSAGIFNTFQAGGLGVNNGDTTHTLTYTFVDANGCVNTSDMSVTLIFGDTVEAGPNLTVCIDEGLIILTDQIPLGGTWSSSSSGVDPSGVFDPVAAGVGTHTLTYTYGSGTCEKMSVRTITVGAVPTVNAGVDLNICEADAAFILGGNTPVGGTWSGIGITDSLAGLFDPTVSGTGTFTIIYAFANSATGCEGIDTRIITVNSLPIVTTEDSTTYCFSSNNIQLTGFTPTLGGQWSGAGIVNPNTGVFNPGQTSGLGVNNGDTLYVLTYSYTDGNGCTDTETLEVTLTEGDTVEAGPDIAVCVTDAPFALTGNLPTTGGTWYGTGITDPVTGIFDPASAGAGTFVITWEFGTGTCLKTSTRTITVGSPPTVTAGLDEFMCKDQGQVLLGGYSPVGGIWNGNGIVDSLAGLFDVDSAGIGQHTISYYVVNNITGCENIDYKTITVGDLPLVQVTDSVLFCDNPNNILLTDYVSVTPAGGIWSGPGVVDPVNGIFNTTIAGGLPPTGDTTHTLIYTYVAGNTCEAEDTLAITVIYGDTVVSGPNDTLCLGDNPITFTGFSPAGGTWSGLGIINVNSGEFDPNASGVGLHTLTYTYGTGTCEKQVTKTVLVDAPPTISIGPDQTICIDATPFTLGGYSPQGGIWSGVGITDSIVGTFNPAAANIGTHTLTYEFVNSVSGCSNTDTRDITVVPLPMVTAGDTLLFCDNPDNVTLGDYVNYNPPGGNWSGAGIVDPINGIFNTTSAGGLGFNGLDTSYTIVYGYTDGNGCFADDDLVINVTYGDTVVAGPNVALCIDQGLYQLQGFSPFGGLWSGLTTNANNAVIDAVNGIIDPQVAGPGPHTFIYTYGQGTCQKQDTKVVFIGTPPVVNPGSDQTLCIDAPAFTLGGFSPAGGVWTGPGVLDSLTGVFDPVAAGVGTHTLFYRVSNLITGCETINSKDITINPLPIVYAGDTLEVCNNPNDIILTGYSPAGGVWSGSGIIDATGGVFNTNVAGGLGVNGADTIYPVVYSFTDANVCSNDDVLYISVIYGDTVLAGLNDSVCIDDAAFALGGLPVGGVWSGIGVNAANGTFSPMVAGAGSHVVIYIYGSGTCEKTDQKIIYVGTPIPVDAGADQYACEDALQLFLSGQSINDGIWSGAGVIDGVTGEFNPQVVGVGFHTVVYTYTNPVTGCVSFDTKQVEVKALPVVNAGGTVTYCNWPLDIQLTNYSPTGNGGVWSGAGIINGTQGTFNASIAGGLGYNGADTVYTVTYDFVDQFGCTNNDDLDISIIYGDTVYAGPDITVCIDGGNVQLLGNYPVGGYFSGVGVDSFGVFDPTITGGGVHDIVYTQGVETCVKSDTLEVTVVDLTGTTAGPDENTCLESGPIMLTGNSPLGGIWTGSGIIDNTLGIFEPLAANADTVFITYTYTDTLSGCQYSDTKMVTRNSLPNIDFIFSSDTLCIGDTLSFTNTSDANVNIFKWFFGDGDSSIFFQPTHIYNAAGTYQVMLIGISPEGCPDTTVQDIVIYELPTPSFAMNADNGCGPLPVTFTNTSVGQDTEFLWDFGNGQTSTLASPGTITFQQGVFDTLYIVTLDVTNRCGTVSFTDTVFVDPIPVVVMGANLTSGCTPLPVDFTNFSTGNATSYLWDFGNGNISTDSIPPTQFFTTVDTITIYTVSLTATNACGSDVETIDITVEPGSINAFFTPDTTIGCQALTVNFASLATPGSTVTWDFGDGNTLAGPAAIGNVITHTFDTSGTFTVTQYVSNYCGLDTFDVQITVHPSPEVNLTHATFVCQDAPLQFTNLSPQQLAGVTWDFGDGTISNQFNPQHAYTTPGTYTVTFTGYSLGFACPADTQTTVQVFGLPNAHFTPSANSGCAPLDVNFTNNSGTGAMFYSWDFGDGNVSNLQNPTHQFTGTGNYSVTLTAADANGCTDDTTMVNFIVFPSPTSAFTPDANQQCGLNDYVELTNTSQGATQYYWDFGNGQFSTLTDPVINYNQLGDYTITLITQNQYNCTDTTQALYSVLSGPEADFEIESQNGCEPLTVQFTQTSTNSTLFYWYFGDGDSAAVANPIHTYTDGGTYDVTMVASLDNQCFDTFYIPGAIFVDQAPTASFTMDEVGDATGTYNFVNSSTGATSYFWDFGDGSTSTDENPQHRYDYNGLRQVMLIAISATGCTDTTIIELEPTFFKGLYVPNAFSPRVGIGDVREFRPIGVGLEEYRVEVFSQWGELLWSSDVLDDNGVPVEGWDGMYNGQLMPQGAYVWKVHAVFKDGSNWEGMPDASGIVRKIGSVTLLD